MSGQYAGFIPSERDRNTAGVAVDAFMKSTGNNNLAIHIELEKNFRLEVVWEAVRRVGRSCVCLEWIAGQPSDHKRTNPVCHGRRADSLWHCHADNVAPSLLGGFCWYGVIIHGYNSVKCRMNILFCGSSANWTQNFRCKKILKQDIPMHDAINKALMQLPLWSGLWRKILSYWPINMRFAGWTQTYAAYPGFALAKETPCFRCDRLRHFQVQTSVSLYVERIIAGSALMVIQKTFSEQD